MMTRDGLLVLCDYDSYASDLVFETFVKLTKDEFSRESSPSHGSVRNLMLHILKTEQGFLSLCQGHEGKVPDLGGAAEMRQYWANLEREMRDWIASQSDDDLNRVVALPFELRGEYHRLPQWQLLTQALVHSIQHRGELSIVLSELGYPMPNADIILHFVQRGDRV